jgi:hypothetical protein
MIQQAMFGFMFSLNWEIAEYIAQLHGKSMWFSPCKGDVEETRR